MRWIHSTAVTAVSVKPQTFVSQPLMQTGAQLLDESVPHQIMEQALVKDNMHTSLPRKAPLNGCLSDLQKTLLSMEETNSTALSFNETTNPLGWGRSMQVLFKDYHLGSRWLLSMRHCQEITRNEMNKNSRIFSGTLRKTVSTAVVCFRVIFVTALAVAPPAEAY